MRLITNGSRLTQAFLSQWYKPTLRGKVGRCILGRSKHETDPKRNH